MKRQGDQFSSPVERKKRKLQERKKRPGKNIKIEADSNNSSNGKSRNNLPVNNTLNKRRKLEANSRHKDRLKNNIPGNKKSRNRRNEEDNLVDPNERRNEQIRNYIEMESQRIVREREEDMVSYLEKEIENNRLKYSKFLKNEDGLVDSSGVIELKYELDGVRNRDDDASSSRGNIWQSLINNSDGEEQQSSSSCTPIVTFERLIEGFPVESSSSGTVFCSEIDCDFKTHRIMQLRHHLVHEHNMQLRYWTTYFNDAEQFQSWKSDYLTKNPHLSLYPVNAKSSDTNKHYYCSLGKKTVMMNGKRRMSNACTSTLHVTYNKLNKLIIAEMIVDHYGHDDGNQKIILPRSNFTSKSQYIETLVRNGATREEFIRVCANSIDTIEERNESVLEFDRMKLESQCNRFENDVTENSSFSAWSSLIESFGENSLYVLKSGKSIEVQIRMPTEINVEPLRTEEFNEEDFFLAYMSESQKKILLRNMNMYVLENTTPDHKRFKIFQLFVLDSSKNIAPVSLCYTTAKLDISLNYFFRFLKCACGDIKPSLLVCNSFAEAFEEWTKVFENVTEIEKTLDYGISQFISPWYVEKEFWNVMNSCNLDDQTKSEVFENFLRLRGCQSGFIYNKIRVDVMNKFNSNGLRPMFDFVSTHLLSNPYGWSTYQIGEYFEEFHIMIAYFTEINTKRFNKFATRKIGKCIPNFLHFQLSKDTSNKDSARRPGKQRDAIVGAPALNRLQSLRTDPKISEPLAETDIKKVKKYKVTNEDLTEISSLLHQYKKMLHVVPDTVRLDMRKTLLDLMQELTVPAEPKVKSSVLRKIERAKTDTYSRKYSLIRTLPKPLDLGPKNEMNKEHSAVVPCKYKVLASNISFLDRKRK